MYGRSEKIDKYYEDKEMFEKREQTRAELKALLKQYVGKSYHVPMCARRVGHA